MAAAKTPLRSKLIVLTAVLASLLEIIDTAIVNVAVPTMMGNLGATLDEISWIITGYIIANAIVLPIAGWMSEQLGRKNYYTACIVLFTAASVACGLAPNLPTLVVFRVLQGLAGGALLPTSQALIYEAFPKEQAGMASAIYGMSVMIGPTVGPTLGGYLTDHFGWRSIFNINLPIGFIVCVLSWILVEDVGYDPQAQNLKSTPQKRTILKPKHLRTPVDTYGLILLVLGIGCLQFVLERGHAEDWFDSKIITASLITGICSIVGLIWWELRTPYPILQLRHFKNVTFRSGVFLMAGLGAMLYGLIFMIPIFVTTIHSFSATQTGELFIPGALVAAMCMPFIGKQLRTRDPRQLIFIGIIGLGAAILWISQFDSQTSTEGMFGPLLLRGIALSFLFVPINSTVLTQFSGAAISQAAGMLNLCRQLGGSIAIALMSTLFQHYQKESFSILSAKITWFDPVASQAYQTLDSAFRNKLPALVGMAQLPTNASMTSVKVLLLRLNKEAFVLAYQKVMATAAVAFLLTLIPLYFMRRPSIKRPS